MEAAIGLAADGTAVVELAFASGLNLPSSRERDPATASTYGTGALMAEAARPGGTPHPGGGRRFRHERRRRRAIAATEERGGLRGAEVVILSDVTTRFADAARVIVLDLLDFDARLAASSAVFVGEGRLDSQTSQGKIIAAILARAGTTPAYAGVGSVDADLGDHADGLAGIMVAGDAAAMGAAGELLANVRTH